MGRRIGGAPADVGIAAAPQRGGDEHRRRTRLATRRVAHRQRARRRSKMDTGLDRRGRRHRGGRGDQRTHVAYERARDAGPDVVEGADFPARQAIAGRPSGQHACGAQRRKRSALLVDIRPESARGVSRRRSVLRGAARLRAAIPRAREQRRDSGRRYAVQCSRVRYDARHPRCSRRGCCRHRGGRQLQARQSWSCPEFWPA